MPRSPANVPAATSTTSGTAPLVVSVSSKRMTTTSHSSACCSKLHRRHPLKLLDWCLMPNHWHFVVWPDKDRQLTAFFRWLTHTHTMRSITHRSIIGMGPLYQGRFKSLPVQEDRHLLTLLRYVERNPVRAKLAGRAALWRWGSEGVRHQNVKELKPMLSDWPIPRPRDWPRQLNDPPSAAESKEIRDCIRRNRPLGDAAWTAATAKRLHLEWTLRPQGRPPGKRGGNP